MFGNILLVLSSLFWLGLLGITASPAPGGDRGMGYGLAIFFCGAGFVILTGILAWRLSATHHFDWLPALGGSRGLFIFFAWLAFAMATFFGALFRSEWHPGELPVYLHWLSLAQVSIWLPVLMLGSACWLINAGTATEAPPPLWVQVPMKIGLAVSILMFAGLIFGYFKNKLKQDAANREYYQAFEDKQHKEHLASIEAQKPDDPLVNILNLTGRFHDQDVRDAAVAKVKSRPDWEAELIRLLNDTEWQSQVYQFIDGNTVDHPDLFVEPINRSIRRTAAEIKMRIKNANDLQEWHFDHFSIDRCLRAIDTQFSSVPGADFRPALRELRAALDTPKPERFATVKFGLTPIVDAWLKQHP